MAKLSNMPETQDAPPSRVSTNEDAADVSSFLLRPSLFGTPLTPGEAALFRENPQVSIHQREDACWFFRNAEGRVCAALGMRHHANHTGIHEIYAFAVDPTHRSQGFGRRLLAYGLEYVASVNGRGLIIDTSSHPSYSAMHALLDSLEFKCVGRFPDFYYPGEDTLWYYHAVDHAQP